MWLTRILNGIEDWAFPAVCVACGAAGAAPRFDLCPGCEGDLPPWAPLLRAVVTPGDSPTEAPTEASTETLAPLPAGGAAGGCVDACWAAFTYEFPVDALIRDCKFHGRHAYAAVLGLAAARRWQALRPFELNVDGVLPVPLHRARLRERGFNQAYEMARPFCRCLDVPLLEGLVERRVATSAQSGLDARQRRRNLQGAFAMRRPAHGLEIALFDDVFTTGATMSELARVLLAAGAARVVGLSVARVP